MNIKEQYGDKALAIFVMPPSVEVLEERLRARSTDSEENITKRMNKAKHELSKAEQFDIVIINDTLEEAIEQTRTIVSDFLK
jgi:guanylate kinase